MKKIAALLVAVCLFMSISGCESSTSYGKCVGVGDEDDRKPNLVYKVSIRNVIMSVVFIESLVIPLVVGLEELYCPVSVK